MAMDESCKGAAASRPEGDATLAAQLSDALPPNIADAIRHQSPDEEKSRNGAARAQLTRDGASPTDLYTASRSSLHRLAPSARFATRDRQRRSSCVQLGDPQPCGPTLSTSRCRAALGVRGWRVAHLRLELVNQVRLIV